MALTAAERETVISISDDENEWTIHTSQRKMVTQLLKNPSATILEDTTFQGTRMLVATVPANGITVRKGKGTPRKVAGRAPRNIDAPTCGGVKSDGSKCGMVAKNGSGFCRHHQDQK